MTILSFVTFYKQSRYNVFYVLRQTKCILISVNWRRIVNLFDCRSKHTYIEAFLRCDIDNGLDQKAKLNL